MDTTITYELGLDILPDFDNELNFDLHPDAPIGTYDYRFVIASRLLFMDQDFVIVEVCQRMVRHGLLGKRIKTTTKNASGKLSFEKEEGARAALAALKSRPRP